MRIGLISVFLLSILSIGIFAQPQWYAQNSQTNTFLFDVHFADKDNGWIAGNTGTILNTTDGGITWNEQTTPPNNTYYCVYFSDAMHGWAGGFGGRLIHTTDGGSNWINGTAGTNKFRYDLYFINADSGWVVGGDHGSYPTFNPNREIYFTSNGGITWVTQYAQSGETPLNAVYFIDKNNGFAVGETGAIMKTTNGGNYWFQSATISSYELRDIVFVNQNTGWMVGYYLGLPHTSAVFKTTDGGSTWTNQSFGEDESFTSITFVDELNGWAVGGKSSISQSFIIHTNDGGSTWEYQNNPTNEFLMKVFFFDGNNGWTVGASGTVLATESSVPVELISFTASANVNSVKLDWRTSTETNNSGFEIYRSVKGDKFENIGFIDGNGTTTEESFYSYMDRNLTSGIYSYKLVQLDYDGTKSESDIVKVEIVSQPDGFSLDQNYPNPFNPSTNISFTLQTSSNTKLKIFNAIGEEVETLVNGFKEAGNYEANFNASNLASGIYYYRLETADFTSMKKMILLK